MESSATAIPGFRSLSQAGIQLGEGGPPVATPEEAGGNANADPLSKAQRPQSVAVQPREPGTKRPLPRELAHAGQNTGVPNGLYVGQLPTLQFSCPCCGVVLTITDPGAYNGKPGPCPHCSAVVLPPRVISPFAMAATRQPVAPTPEESTPRHYSGFAM